MGEAVDGKIDYERKLFPVEEAKSAIFPTFSNYLTLKTASLLPAVARRSHQENDFGGQVEQSLQHGPLLSPTRSICLGRFSITIFLFFPLLQKSSLNHFQLDITNNTRKTSKEEGKKNQKVGGEKKGAAA